MAIADEHATFGVTCRRWNIGLADGRTGQGRPLEDGLRIDAQCFNRSIVATETFEGLHQFNERDHPDRRAETTPVTPGLARSV